MLREDMVWTEGIETFFKDEAPKAGLEIAGISVVPVDVEDLTPYFRSAEQAGAQMMMTFISVFGERLANQAWANKVPMAIFGHNGVLNDYGYWNRSNGAWGTMATTSTWGSLEKQAADWRDFVTEWYTTYSDDPRTPIWVGECTWRAINSYKEAVERANTFDLAKVIPELEKTYYPDAPTRGGFYGKGQGDWPHAWCSPIDATEMAKPDPTRAAGTLGELSLVTDDGVGTPGPRARRDLRAAGPVRGLRPAHHAVPGVVGRRQVHQAAVLEDLTLRLLVRRIRRSPLGDATRAGATRAYVARAGSWRAALAGPSRTAARGAAQPTGG